MSNLSLVPVPKPAAERRLALVPTGPHNLTSDQGLKPMQDQLDTSAGQPTRVAGTLASGRKAWGRGTVSSDDNVLTKQVVATHAPDTEDLDVRPILAVVEDILRLARPVPVPNGTSVKGGAEVAPQESSVAAKLDENALHHSAFRPFDDKLAHATLLLVADPDADIIKTLAYSINKISSEIVCKCSDGGDTHVVTIELLKSLSTHSWDAKAVIVFAAFAITYGEFWLVEQLQRSHPLAKNIAALKDLPPTIDHSGDLRMRFEAMMDLMTQVFRVTHCIIEFKELPRMYLSRDSLEILTATAHVPTAVYWVVRSLVVCASILFNLIGSGHEYMASTAESWEILNLAHKLSVIFEHLKNQLRKCTETINKKKAEDAYIAFKKLMEATHIDNMKVLKAMIKSRDDQRPLYDCSKQQNECIESLRLKYVLLLISDLELPQEELNILHSIYTQHAMRHEYEVLWLPVTDQKSPLTSAKETTFYELRNNMPWHSVSQPSLVEPVAARYIREAWGFMHTPMLVVLDPQGKPANLDALPMMWIWGTSAFPFTRAREGALWDESSWNIDLLVDAIDPRFSEWIRDNKTICVYGGEDIEWIQRFTKSARAAAGAVQVPLEMLYVGKRYPKEKVRRCHEVIHREKLSHIFAVDYYDYVWFFWVRLWSMWNSKKQMGKTVDNDGIMHQIMDILAFDSSEQGWAVFSRGNYEITKGNGEKVVPILENHTNWGPKVDHPDKFVSVLDEQLREFHQDHHCTRLILPGQAGYVPERVICSECGKVMDQYIMYRCCTD